MLYGLLLFAEGEAAKGQPEGPGPLGFLMPMLLIGLVFYFLLIRPQTRERDRMQKLISELKKNDKVLNQGGIIGIVDSIKEKEDEVILKGGIHITKSSIVRIMKADEAAKEDS
jgi:preprotein translocase subunit YajC